MAWDAARPARAARASSSQRLRRSRVTVLTGANSRDRKRARTRVNAEAGDARKVLQTTQKGGAAAKAREGAFGLDKLGVTGSSPVPPITKAAVHPNLPLLLAVVVPRSCQGPAPGAARSPG